MYDSMTEMSFRTSRFLDHFCLCSIKLYIKISFAAVYYLAVNIKFLVFNLKLIKAVYFTCVRVHKTLKQFEFINYLIFL